MLIDKLSKKEYEIVTDFSTMLFTVREKESGLILFSIDSDRALEITTMLCGNGSNFTEYIPGVGGEVCITYNSLGTVLPYMSIRTSRSLVIFNFSDSRTLGSILFRWATVARQIASMIENLEEDISYFEAIHPITQTLSVSVSDKIKFICVSNFIFPLHMCSKLVKVLSKTIELTEDSKVEGYHLADLSFGLRKEGVVYILGIQNNKYTTCQPLAKDDVESLIEYLRPYCSKDLEDSNIQEYLKTDD